MKLQILGILSSILTISIFTTIEGHTRVHTGMPAILAFGDSIVDPGNNNDLATIVKCNFLPYGKSFRGGQPTGRFSNGRIPTDILAKEMGIKPYLPAYLDPDLQPEELLTGVSFASGATGFDPKTPEIASALSLSDQIDMFKEYIEKVERMVGERRTKSILTASLFLIVAGSDDIANTYFITPYRRLEYNISSYTDLLVNSASSFIQEIYRLGARKILVVSLPPIGCVPSQRTLAGGLSRECSEKHNEAARLLNSKLLAEINLLNKRLLSSRVVYGDIYHPVLEIIHNPQQYGFQVVDKGCCGTGLLEVSILCTKYNPVCSDESTYLFWDSYHPSEAGYKVVTRLILKVIRDQMI